MAAAAWTRCTGVTDVRTTKGILLIATLLSLVYSTSSIFDKNQLADFREKHQTLKEDMKTLKALHMFGKSSADELGEYINCRDRGIALFKKLQTHSLDDFPSKDSDVDDTKTMLEETKAFLDKMNMETGVKIDHLEKELGKHEKLLNFLEEQEAEL